MHGGGMKTQSIRLYNEVNNSFRKKLIFHVGTGEGFYSEINGMLTAMLYCYVHKIKFILYADDATFAGGNGWNEFFVPFCPQSHDELNHKYNARSKGEGVKLYYRAGQMLLKIRNGVNYLTNDIFARACLGDYSKESTYARWTEFDIDGDIQTEFAKLRCVALQYNRNTAMEIKAKIRELNLPAHYYSVQFRGGDKTLEVMRSMDVDCVIERMKRLEARIDNLFVFTDDFAYVEKIKERCPEWNIYTLTKENEHGYNNSDFNRISWSLKRKEMIKLFAMTEICLHSDIHFGCEVACVNDYIKSAKPSEKYAAVWTEEDAGLNENFRNRIQRTYN